MSARELIKRLEEIIAEHPDAEDANVIRNMRQWRADHCEGAVVRKDEYGLYIELV